MPRCDVCETNLPNAYHGLGYFNHGSSWACEPCRGVMRKENKGHECLLCRWRPASDGAYERVVCEECTTYRTGRGQEAGYTKTDCGSCGNYLTAYQLMRCGFCGESMCEECPGDTQACVGCSNEAEEFGAEGCDDCAEMKDILTDAYVYLTHEGLPCERCGSTEMSQMDTTTDHYNMMIDKMEWYSAEEFGAERLPYAQGYKTPIELRQENHRLRQELLQCREALTRIEHITEQEDVSDAALGYIHNVCETVLKDKRPAHTNIPDFDAESFGADFTYQDISALREHIDMPPESFSRDDSFDEERWRRVEQKRKGMLPRRKGIEAHRHQVIKNLPPEFRMFQLGLIGLLATVITVTQLRNGNK